MLAPSTSDISARWLSVSDRADPVPGSNTIPGVPEVPRESLGKDRQ